MPESPRTPCTRVAASRARRCPRPRTPCSCIAPPVLADLSRCIALPCSQMLPPPHSLHLLRNLPCSQMPPPPHSLHRLRRLPWSQMPEPPHSLQLYRTLPCSQIPFPGHSLHKYPPLLFPCGHFGRNGPFASPERGRLPRLFGMSSRGALCSPSATRPDLPVVEDSSVSFSSDATTSTCQIRAHNQVHFRFHSTRGDLVSRTDGSLILGRGFRLGVSASAAPWLPSAAAPRVRLAARPPPALRVGAAPRRTRRIAVARGGGATSSTRSAGLVAADLVPARGASLGRKAARRAA